MKTPLQLVKRVLVCEYSKENHPVLSRILTRYGHAVTMSSSLSEMLRIFTERPAGTFALILVDVIEEEKRMDWVSDVRRKQPNIGLLATSACLGYGFRLPARVAYLPKPFSCQQLDKAVAEAIRRVAGASPAAGRSARGRTRRASCPTRASRARSSATQAA